MFLRHPHHLDLEGNLVSWDPKTDYGLEHVLHASDAAGKGARGSSGSRFSVLS